MSTTTSVRPGTGSSNCCSSTRCRPVMRATCTRIPPLPEPAVTSTQASYYYLSAETGGGLMTTGTAIGRPPPPRSRLAVVSGGGTGIGRASAAALLDDGCAVMLLGRRRDVLDRTVDALGGAHSGCWITGMQADVSDPDDVAAVAATVRSFARGVDVVVNNAGSTAAPASGPDELAGLASAWSQTYRANVVSAVLLTTALEPLL